MFDDYDDFEDDYDYDADEDRWYEDLADERIAQVIYPTVDGELFIKNEHYIAHLLERTIASDVPVHMLYNDYEFQESILSALVDDNFKQFIKVQCHRDNTDEFRSALDKNVGSVLFIERPKGAYKYEPDGLATELIDQYPNLYVVTYINE